MANVKPVDPPGGVKIAVRSLVVIKDKELCIGCQKPNKTRYMIIDKDIKPASAYTLSQKFYGLPFASVDQNRQTYMCRICYRLIQKYYGYTEKARQIKETLQKTTAKLETVVIIKHKEKTPVKSESEIDAKNCGSENNISTRRTRSSGKSITVDDQGSNLGNSIISGEKEPKVNLVTESVSLNNKINECVEKNISKKRTRKNSEESKCVKEKSAAAKQNRDSKDDSEIEESDSDKEGTEEPKVKYRVVEQLEEATYTKADVMKSLEKLESPGSGSRGHVTYVNQPAKKRVREVKYRSLAIAEMYGDAIKSLADGSVRKAIKLVARVTDKSKRKDFLDAVEDLVNTECRTLEKKENSEALRYSSIDEIKFSNMLKEVKKHCPVFWSCVVSAANGNVSKPDVCDNKILAAVAILLQNRNGNINAFQTFISLMAKEYHIKKEGLNILNQFGITLSSKTTYSRLHHSDDNRVKDEDDEDQIGIKEKEIYVETVDDEDMEKTVIDHTYCTQEELESAEFQDVVKDMASEPATTISVVDLATVESMHSSTIDESTMVTMPPENRDNSAQEKEDILETSMIALTEHETIEDLDAPNSPEEYMVEPQCILQM